MKKEIFPMAAHGGGEQFFGNVEYLVEPKLDGARYTLQWDSEGNPHLLSRQISVKDGLHVDKTETLMGYLYYGKDETLAGTILDGEIIVYTGDKGNGSAEVNKIMLSKPEKARERLKQTSLKFVVFDLLELNGKDFRNEALLFRRTFLDSLFKKELFLYPNIEKIVEVPNIPTVGQRLLELGFEGAMLKHKTSIYQENYRSHDWHKFKRLETYDGIVLGGVPGNGKFEGTLGALVVGQWVKVSHEEAYNTENFKLPKHNDDQGNWFILKEVATISGMDDAKRNEFWEKLNAKVTEERITGRGKTCRFIHPQDFSWVVEFEAQEKTKDRYRHPRFVQERPDKPGLECHF